MLIGCYHLHLYCDAPGCKHGTYSQCADAEWTHEFGARCRAMARRAGWWLNDKLGTCACPQCKATGHRPTESA